MLPIAVTLGTFLAAGDEQKMKMLQMELSRQLIPHRMQKERLTMNRPSARNLMRSMDLERRGKQEK
jgi:hypothetical protein